ncbi:MAG: CinA family protein [Candidatus Limnocylindrales bacterium]|jgi:PncC family amidohydrolase
MNSESLAQLVGRLQALCLERGVTVATAESCTGGLVAKLITDVAGSSDYFRGGVVSYADETKSRLLGVSQDKLNAHGAVSAQVARSMAVGALNQTGADVAVAVTGIAGPGGGSPAKPVGLTYVAVADTAGVDVRRFVWAGDRAANRDASARAAVELLLERISTSVWSGPNP